ncbi:hypothetical protein SDC9_68060 [bioreactor metagenome]|uniref:Uncharacterized protein n=1 Tax=bioreactor metagenome TaxID=1076179 RepID=A0A644XZD7_9ZZZZ
MRDVLDNFAVGVERLRDRFAEEVLDEYVVHRVGQIDHFGSLPELYLADVVALEQGDGLIVK